jgi:hypothetical protein
MLSTHFNKSQFVVVSLKDGMFNNANVLFRTDFVDGVSVVKRYTQQNPLPVAASARSHDVDENTATTAKTARPTARTASARQLAL